MNKKRILVIDDEAGFTRMLQLNLEQTGRFEVRTINWPEKALHAAQEFRPDLILLDVLMPGMVGGDVAAQFRADPNLKDVRIIFFTAAVRKSIIAEYGGVVAGDAIIAKPANFDEVLACIDKYLPQ